MPEDADAETTHEEVAAAIAAAEASSNLARSRPSATHRRRRPPATDRVTPGSPPASEPLEMTAIFLAGIAAGTINTVVGSGTLITFPTLLASGSRR